MGERERGKEGDEGTKRLQDRKTARLKDPKTARQQDSKMEPTTSCGSRQSAVIMEFKQP